MDITEYFADEHPAERDATWSDTTKFSSFSIDRGATISYVAGSRTRATERKYLVRVRRNSSTANSSFGLRADLDGDAAEEVYSVKYTRGLAVRVTGLRAVVSMVAN